MANHNSNIPLLPQTLNLGSSADCNHDRSFLSDIDPDFNYLHNNRTVDSDYYNEQEFNRTFSNNLNFSLMHLNIRSLPLHFTELLCYLDTLDIEFKIIALSETVAFWGYHIHLLYNNLLSPNYSYCILHNHLHCSTPVISFCYLIITQLYNYCINTVASDAFVISGS